MTSTEQKINLRPTPPIYWAQENQDLKKEIQHLKEQQVEGEAVEKYMMDVLSKGGGYDDLLQAHYRQGAVVGGEWVDEEGEKRVGRVL